MKVNERETAWSVHRKGFLVFGAIAVLIGLVWGILYAYDTFSPRADGLINGYAYGRIVRLIYTIWLVSVLLYLGIVSRRKLIQNWALSITTTAVLLLLLEFGAHGLLRLDTFGPVVTEFRRYHVDPSMASREPLFWGDFNEYTGRWRMPHTSYSALYCGGDSVFRHTNSVGARDRERTRQKSGPGQKRVIILGDSFMEGMLVNDSSRLSNQLEAATGREHLNFAVNGSSPINYYLVYKHIAKQFEHDVVMVGLLPANDFQDYTPAEAYTLVEWPIYRPYWQVPDYTLKYSLSNIDQSISRNHRMPVKLLKTVDSVYSHLSFADQVRANVLSNSGLYKLSQKLAGRVATTSGRMTRYDQFSDAEFDYMCHSLDQLANEANGKKVVFLSIPIQNDVDAIRNGKKNRLDDRLRAFCHQRGILFVPLLPYFLAYKGNLADLYVTCDGHWSKKGERFVSDILLRNSQYQALLRP